MARRSVVIDLEVRNKQARTSLEGIESGFTDLRGIVDDPIPIHFDADRARASLQGIESGVTSLRKSTQQASSVARKSTEAMASGFNRATSSTNSSIMAVTDLTRIVEDAPFGIRGVANNINPFIQSFQRMGNEATSTGSKMKMLLSSAFTGPGALLTITALVTSAMTAIQMGLFDWGGEAESADEQMENLMDTMDEFIDEQREMGGENIFDPLGQASTQQRLDEVQNLKDELQSLFDLRENARELRQEIDNIDAEISQRGGLQPGSGQLGETTNLPELGDELGEVNDRIEEQERLFEGLSEAQESDVMDKIEDLEATESLNRAFLKLNPALQRQLDLNQALRPVLRDIELGLSGAGEELGGLIEEWEDEADAIRDSIEAGEFQGEQLEEKKNTLAALTEALDQAKESQEDLTEAEQFAGSRFMQDTRQRQQEFQESDLGGTFMDPSSPIQQPEDDVTRSQDVDVFEPIPQSAVDKEIDKLNQVAQGWEKIELEGEEAGESGEQSLEATTAAANMLGNALAQAVIRGEELEGVLKSLAAQLASRAIVTGLGAILTGGSSLGGETFLSAMFSGFAHGTDMGFPGIGRVGERGEELVVAPPMSSIITNENVERMDRMRQEAKSGAVTAATSSPGITIDKLVSAFEQADIRAPVEISRVKRELGVFDELQNRIGN